MKLNRKIMMVLPFMCGMFCTELHSMEVYNISVIDNSGDKIKIQEVKSQKFELEGSVVIERKSEKFPSLNIRESHNSSLELNNGEEKSLTVELGNIDFETIGLSEKDSIVQRLVVTLGQAIVGYISFRCSLHNIHPIITMEPEAGYRMHDQPLHYGGGGLIRISVGKE